MTDVAVAREQTFADAVYEAGRAAPIYHFRPNWFYVAFLVAALAACFIPVFRPFPFDWALLYIGPIAVLFAGAANYGAITTRIGDRYKDQLRDQTRARYASRGVDVEALLDRLWAQKQVTPPYLGIVFLLVAAAMVGAHFWHAFGEVVLSQLVTLGAWLEFLGRLLLFLLGVVISVLSAIVMMMGVWGDTKFSMDDLRLRTFGPRWEMDQSESNLHDVIDHDVELKTMLRRVDNYTLESTLLGALAFSAFVTILVESATPIGDLSWTLGYVLELRQFTMFERTFNLPIVTNLVDLTKDHIGSAIGAFLLAGSVSFLAVLVARIQFTDAFRHAEKLHAKAAKFNEIERDLRKDKNDRAAHFSRQVGELLNALTEASKRITPIISFMRWFRTLGLVLFLAAIAICGLYYSFAGMAFIVFLFISSFVFFTFYERITIGAIVRRVKVLNWVLPNVDAPQQREQLKRA